MHLLDELRRRNVHRTAAAYLVGAWLLVQVAETIFPLFGLGDAPARVTVIVLAALFVPALVLSWVFQITPEGLRRDAGEATPAGTPLPKRSPLDRWVMAGLAIAVGYFAVDKLLLLGAPVPVTVETQSDAPPPAADAGVNTIAVLPFANLSGDAAQEYLSDGVAEQLLGLLSRSPGFRVSARSSSFRFRHSGLDPQDVGRQLGVRYLVEGSVRRAGDRVRIAAALIDVSTGFQVWSSDYERTLSDLLVVQEEIATQVAGALQVVLGAQAVPGRATSSAAVADAHLEFLMARRLIGSRTTTDLDAAMAHLQRAIALDPGYAAAYAELASAMMIRANATPDEPTATAAAAPLIDKALALDPALAEAWVVRARLQHDPQAAEHDLRRGLQLNPSLAAGYVALAQLLMNDEQRIPEALTVIDMARSLDPLSAHAHHIKAYQLSATGELDAAEATWQEAVRVEPRFVAGWAKLSDLHAGRGEYARAVLLAETALAIDPRNDFGRDRLLRHYLSLRDESAARRLREDGKTLISRVLLANFDNDEMTAGEMMLTAKPEELAGFHPWMISDTVLRYALRSDEYDRAMRFASTAFGFDGRVSETLSPDSVPTYLNLCVLWHAAGEPQHQAIEALRRRIQHDRMLSEHWSIFRQHYFAAAVAAAVLGEQEAALDLLEGPYDAVRHPWSWALLYHAAFAPLADHPRFIALVEGSKAHAAAERERLSILRKEAIEESNAD